MRDLIQTKIVSITELRKTQSRWHDESYEMTYVLARPAKEVTFSSYVRKYKEGWCFYSQSQWYLFREEDQDTINNFHSSLVSA